MAATRLIALHKNKGKSVAVCLKSRTDYAQNPDKTEQGQLVSSYRCSPLTVDEEFMLSKRQYELVTGRRQKSDLICLEHSLSVIEIKPYRERQKRVLYPPKESNRDQLCGVIDSILADKPGSYKEFLKKLEQQGYEVKRGKFTSVKGARQKRFIRFRTLGAGYSEEELKAVLAGEAEHCPRKKTSGAGTKISDVGGYSGKIG